MIVIDYILRLLGRPTLLSNGYPNMAANHRYVDNDGNFIMDVTRRINGGDYYLPPPPPIPQLPVEKPEPPMVAEEIYKVKEQAPVREYPSSTSSFSGYFDHLCGATVHHSSEFKEEVKDPLVLDHLPLKRMLTKLFPWILDVTFVKIKTKTRIRQHEPGTIYFGPLEIHITVSPTHHTELMSPKIEKAVREKLYKEMLPLITCMYENNSKDKPIIVFSPIPTETILECIK